MPDLDLIETERLVLSGWRADQVDDLFRLQGDPLVAKYSSIGLWTRTDAERALAQWIELFATRRLGKLRVRRKSDGVFLGRAGYGIYAATGEPEIGYALYPEHWGKGYAHEAARGLRDWIFRETDAPHFIGLADIRNAPSNAILAKLGMTKTHIGPFGHNADPYQFYVYRRAAVLT